MERETLSFPEIILFWGGEGVSVCVPVCISPRVEPSGSSYLTYNLYGYPLPLPC